MTDEYDDQWIETYTGKRFHFLAPHPDEIDIKDIAHALSMKCRFSGHCTDFYSVGEHSIRVADLLPDELKLSGLMHDAAEAYLPDIPRPIKVVFGLKVAEEAVMAVIRKKYNLDDLNPLVKEADNILLATEARDLMKNMDGWAELPQPLRWRVTPHNHRWVEILFREQFIEFGGTDTWEIERREKLKLPKVVTPIISDSLSMN